MKKNLVPRRWLLLALALAAPAAAGLLAAPAAAAAAPAAGSGAAGPTTATATSDPAAVATAYLEARAAAITSPDPAHVLAPFLGAGRLAIREAYVAHGLALRQSDLGHVLDDVTCSVTALDTEVDASGTLATVRAHAVTALSWHGARGPSVEANGLDHRLKLERVGDGWLVTADAYTDVQVPALLERAGVEGIAVARAAARLERSAVALPQTVKTPGSEGRMQTAPIPFRVGYSDRIYYDRDAVKTYADRYALNYNPTYVWFSADCCNFVSQSAYAGSMPQTSGSYDSGWWYDKNGTSGTGDDHWSWSWISCSRQIGYWVGRRIDWVSSISGVAKGDVIYYDWTGDGSWDHVAVLVGTNSAGQKVIDAHTTDYYRVFWKLGSSSTRYAFGRVRAYWVL